jgi:hypothetical protein
MTEDTCHLPPRADRMPRWFNAAVMSRSVVAPVPRIAWMIGSKPATNSSAVVVCTVHPISSAREMLLGLPSLAPPVFFAANAALVRSEIVP